MFSEKKKESVIHIEKVENGFILSIGEEKDYTGLTNIHVAKNSKECLDITAKLLKGFEETKED